MLKDQSKEEEDRKNNFTDKFKAKILQCKKNQNGGDRHRVYYKVEGILNIKRQYPMTYCIPTSCYPKSTDFL